MLTQLQSIITTIAREELLPRFARVTRLHKVDGSLLTEADTTVQQRIETALKVRWPTIPLLGEEMPQEQQLALLAHSDDGLWCLDPLDGTSNFASGIPYFAVSLSLIRHGQVELGLVYDPGRDECFTARAGGGAHLNGTPLASSPPPPPGKGIGLIDFKRLPAALATRLATRPAYASQRSFGAVALDWCWLAAGRGHVYLHGRQNLWDYSAGLRIFLEAGGQALTLEGKPVFVASLGPRSAAAALDPATFTAWIDYLGITPRT